MPATRLNLARFDFVTIRLVVACLRTGSLTQAARACHLVTPAASRRLRELEDAVGHRLFERHSRGLTPTPAGRIVAQRGLALLQEMDAMVGELQDAGDALRRTVHLHASTAAINQFLPPLLAGYAERRPQVRVVLEEQVSAQVVAALRDSQADLGVFVEGPDARDLEVVPFRTDELVLVLPRGHRLAGRTPIAFADTLDEPWISLDAGAALLAQQLAAAQSAGRVFRLRMQVRSFDAVGHLVASGLGIAALPRQACLPLLRALRLGWRPLADGWARRRLCLGLRPEADATVRDLRDWLAAPSPSPNAKTA